MGRAPDGRLKDAGAAGLHAERIWHARAACGGVIEATGPPPTAPANRLIGDSTRSTSGGDR
jgi:hypothetical protein